MSTSISIDGVNLPSTTKSSIKRAPGAARQKVDAGICPDREDTAIRAGDVAIQQAKKTDSQPQFLQIAAKPSRGLRKGGEAKPELKLTRVAFTVSRLMEFCSKREL